MSTDMMNLLSVVTVIALVVKPLLIMTVILIVRKMYLSHKREQRRKEFYKYFYKRYYNVEIG